MILVNTGIQNFWKRNGLLSQQADTGAFSKRGMRNRAPWLLLTLMGVPQPDLCALPWDLANCKITFYVVSCRKMTHATPGNYHTFSIKYVAKQLLQRVVSFGLKIFLSSTQPSKNGKEKYFHCCKICNMKGKQTLHYCCFKIFFW